MAFKINGVDITTFIEEDGIKWQRNDIEAADTGRTLDATMYRGRVAIKIRLDVTCRPLYTAQANVVMQAILPEFVTVEYDDPLFGHRTATMYSNNVPATTATIYPDGDALWQDITFPLVER